MTILENFLPEETVEMGRMAYMRFFTWCRFIPGLESTSTFIRCGKLKPKGNIYAWPEEEQCSGHICRKIVDGVYFVHVIRDDGTVWKIDLRAFETVTPIKVLMANE